MLGVQHQHVERRRVMRAPRERAGWRTAAVATSAVARESNNNWHASLRLSQHDPEGTRACRAVSVGRHGSTSDRRAVSPRRSE